MEDNLSGKSRTARSNHCYGIPTSKKRKAKFHLLDLPEDMICIILTKLSLKDVVRTSVLSSKWRSIQTINPKLRFDGTMCSRSFYGTKEYTQEFIQNVNATLQQHNGMFVQDFVIQFELHSELVIHLDNWVRFVAASQTKNLAFDLLPDEIRGHDDEYLFPFELLNGGSTIRLQRIQLGFVSIKLPSPFSGFPNLRKLDLHLVRVTAQDLEVMLSSSSSLEWLGMVRCHLDDELKVDLPLPHLIYLCVAKCLITGIKLNAMNLKTFVYKGCCYPIDLTQSLELNNAHLYFFDPIDPEPAITKLPAMFPSVKNLSMQAKAPLKMLTMVENACKFSQLKYLQLELSISYDDTDNILSLASYLRAAPFVEKFELHFLVFAIPHSDWEPLRSLPRRPHNYLKKLYITGFVACTGQLEFLLHALENAPVLEALTLDPNCKYDTKGDMDYGGRSGFLSRVREVSRRHINGRISPTTKLCIL